MYICPSSPRWWAGTGPNSLPFLFASSNELHPYEIVVYARVNFFYTHSHSELPNRRRPSLLRWWARTGPSVLLFLFVCSNELHPYEFGVGVSYTHPHSEPKS